jgi:hypothetical protein
MTTRGVMRWVVVGVLVMLPGVSVAGEQFDGQWMTTMSCPAKGKTEGYTWKFVSTVSGGNLRGERGTAGRPGYLLIEGAIKEDGSAKLAASGLVTSKEYATGMFTTTGSEYSYNVKARFKATEGSGMRDKGLGIVGRPCTFDFVKVGAGAGTGG